MKKEELITLGLTEETAAKVAEKSAEELKGYIPKERFNEVNEQKKGFEAQVAERDKQLKTLKESADASEALKGKIAELEKANKAAKDEFAAQLKMMRLDHAVETALTKAKAKNVKAARALLDLSDAEISEDGTVKGLEKQIKKLTEDEGTSFLFETANTKGDDGKNGKDGGVKGMTPAGSSASDPSGVSVGARYALAYNAAHAPAAANPNGAAAANTTVN